MSDIFIELPIITTLIPSVPLEYVGPIVHRDELIKPASTKDRDLIQQDFIDCDRLIVEKSKTKTKGGGKPSYSVAELKGFAQKAGIRKSQSKPKLVAELRARYCN